MILNDMGITQVTTPTLSLEFLENLVYDPEVTITSATMDSYSNYQFDFTLGTYINCVTLLLRFSGPLYR